MNILVIVSSLQFGGAEKQAVIDANLLTTNHKVTLAAFQDGSLRTMLNEKVDFVLIRKSNYVATSLRLAHLFRRKNIEIVHAHLFAAMSISAISSILIRINVIWNFHAHSYKEHYGRFLLRFLSKCSCVKCIVFPATELQEYYSKEKYAFPAKKNQVIYNCTDKAPMKESPNEQSIFTIGFAGRIVPLKRVQYLIELAQKLQQQQLKFKVFILGDGEELPRLKAIAHEQGLNQHVCFEGFHEDLTPWYRSFNVFILPSEEEVLSLALIDAGIMGIPSIAFPVGGNGEIILHEKTGYIVSNLEEMLEKTIFLYNHPKHATQMGTWAKEHCNKKFSEKVRKETLEALYKKAVKA